MDWKFRNVELEKDGEDQLDQLCEKWGSVTQSQGGEEYPTNSKRKKANWIDHILSKSLFSKTRYWRKDKRKWREGEGKDVNNYWITLWNE